MGCVSTEPHKREAVGVRFSFKRDLRGKRMTSRCPTASTCACNVLLRVHVGPLFSAVPQRQEDSGHALLLGVVLSTEGALSPGILFSLFTNRGSWGFCPVGLTRVHPEGPLMWWPSVDCTEPVRSFLDRNGPRFRSGPRTGDTSRMSVGSATCAVADVGSTTSSLLSVRAVIFWWAPRTSPLDGTRTWVHAVIDAWIGLLKYIGTYKLQTISCDYGSQLIALVLHITNLSYSMFESPGFINLKNKSRLEENYLMEEKRGKIIHLLSLSLLPGPPFKWGKILEKPN